jgi:hypothetical protein
MGSLESVISNDGRSDGELRYSPRVIQLLSNALSSGNFSPFLSAFSLSSFASFAVRNRLLRRWFIFARGITPSTAMKNIFFGFIFLKR